MPSVTVSQPRQSAKSMSSANRKARVKRTVNQNLSKVASASLASAPVDQVHAATPTGKSSWQIELSKAAVAATSALVKGDRLGAVARETARFVRQQPELVDAFSRAVCVWEARHSNVKWAEGVPNSIAKTMGKAANSVGGPEAAALVHAGVQGLESNGILGAVANLAKNASQVNGWRSDADGKEFLDTAGFAKPGFAAKASGALAKVAKAVPGVTTVEGLEQGWRAGAGLIGAVDGLKFVQKLQRHDTTEVEKVPVHIRAANVIRAAAEIALWYFQTLGTA